MIFAVTTPESYADFTAPLVREYEDSDEQGFSITGEFSIRDIHVGDTHYALRRPIKVFPAVEGGQWICRLQGHSELTGMGDSQTAAFENLQDVFHATFQRLYAMRPFEMNHDELQLWAFLTGITDVADYKDRTPFQSREIGQIRFKRVSFPSEIRWLDGRREPIALQNVPDQMAGYKPGQWFECVSLRDPETGKLIRISSCQRIPSVRPAPADYADSIAAAQLPTVESSLE